MSISIVDTFPKNRWEELKSFIKQTHGNNHVMQNKELFDWFYSPNPHCDEYNIVVGVKNNQIISILGYLPTKFLVNGNVIAGTWTALWFTLPGERSGVGALLMKRLMELFPIVAGQGASAMNKNIVEALAHEFEPKIPKMVGIIDRVPIQDLFQESHKFTEKLLIPVKKSKKKDNSSINLEINWEQYADIKFGTLRDADYIQRKYLANPFLQYEIIVTGNKHNPTIAIVRIIQTDLGFKVGRIVEFFGPEISNHESQWKDALDEIVMLSESRECAYIDFYSTSIMINQFMSRRGFYGDNEGALPSLLDPVEKDRKSQNLEVFIDPGLKAKENISIRNFFVTRGDGDQDRPNASYEILAK
jgi:hypothetical protein